VHIVFGLVVLVATVIAVTELCKRYDLSSPLVLIVVGIVASYLPFVPDVSLEPEVVLVGLLPPLLYSAALNTSLVDFNANRRAILLLSVGLVIATTLVVGAAFSAASTSPAGLSSSLPSFVDSTWRNCPAGFFSFLAAVAPEATSPVTATARTAAMIHRDMPRA
jgi:NhaP-type Na+/H+ or K+/H+ antiporter